LNFRLCATLPWGELVTSDRTFTAQHGLGIPRIIAASVIQLSLFKDRIGIPRRSAKILDLEQDIDPASDDQGQPFSA
jgi:hypothetical protein